MTQLNFLQEYEIRFLDSFRHGGLPRIPMYARDDAEARRHALRDHPDRIYHLAGLRDGKWTVIGGNPLDAFRGVQT